ncbi:MAG: hypothetical protein ACFBWO_03460 [Paracoccaceae bacterium]
MLSRRYLQQPRGTGTGWVFRMKTPDVLLGRPNPRLGGKPYGRMVHEGLGTRCFQTAAIKRDILTGMIRQEAFRASRDFAVSDEAAARWAEMKRADAGKSKLTMVVTFDNGEDAETEWDPADDLIAEQAERVEQVRGTDVALRWHALATGKAVPFALAVDEYTDARREDFAKSTLNDLPTERKRFLAFAGDHVTLQDVDRVMVYRFLNEWMPAQRTHRAPDGPARATIERSKTLLGEVWDWARQSGMLPYEHPNAHSGLIRSGVPITSGR